jgi:hypothetical protein
MTHPHSTRRTLALFGALVLVGAMPLAAQAKSKSKSKSSKNAKTSSDTERQKLEDARLTRECKGRPNAGACLGYAN